ncbi:hypothetical protein SAMN05428966_10297 [Massilia sp. PDC64]|nr:hypothetical protein [Massilia sp. PDC64]SDC67947.1 hypothetical protein SAMN05428966_10297 [Massilia sp. PDC64]
MNENTDILHEARRLRLLAAVLELQHYTSTESNIVPIPGGDRVIAIGTPAQVRALLADERCPHCDGTGDVHRPDGTWAGTCTCPAGAARPAIDAAAICDGVAAKSKNSLFRSGAKICAGEIRAAQAGADQVDSEGSHHD